MNQPKLILVVLLVLIGGGAFISFNRSSFGNSEDGVQGGQLIRASATISNRSYIPGQINVPLGAIVELTVRNNDNEQHGLFLQDFGVQDFVGPLQTKTIKFVANRQGTSSTFCSATHPEKLIINVN